MTRVEKRVKGEWVFASEHSQRQDAEKQIEIFRESGIDLADLRIVG